MTGCRPWSTAAGEKPWYERWGSQDSDLEPGWETGAWRAESVQKAKQPLWSSLGAKGAKVCQS
jgi:hypothetical protein